MSQRLNEMIGKRKENKDYIALREEREADLQLMGESFASPTLVPLWMQSQEMTDSLENGHRKYSKY